MRSIRLQASSLVRSLAIFGLAGGLAGCGEIQPVAPQEQPTTDPTRLYMRLTLDHPAANLSTAPGYNTLQLTATPRDALGNPMVGLPAPTFSGELLDTRKMRVTADGLVTALETGTQFKVIATLTIGPVTHADTAWINVTNLAPPPELDSISIDPLFPDSAKWPAPGSGSGGSVSLVMNLARFFRSTTLAPRAMSTTGGTISGLSFEYTSLDPAVAKVNRRTGVVSIGHPGQVHLVARTTAYGVTKADTATFTVTMPVIWQITVRPGLGGLPTFSASITGAVVAANEITIAPYGMVSWSNETSDSVDVTFDDPANVAMPPATLCNFASFRVLFSADACGTGDMLLPGTATTTVPKTIRVRQFPVPGIYAYHSMRTGAAGRIVVTNDVD